MRCYSELILLKTFEERFEYLSLGGRVGSETFGYDRYLNQAYYGSREWKKVRNNIIIRDLGCDLGIEGYEILDPKHTRIHHMNPLTKEQILNRDPIIFDPEYLITTTLRTHNAIHYGDASLVFTGFTERRPNDTCPWKG